MQGSIALRSRLSGRVAYVVLLVLLGALLGIGASHHETTNAARITTLENEIRCPSCEDASLAQSEAPTARGLRAEVARLVDEGKSDQSIEALIEASFPGTLLVPSGGIGLVAWLLPLCAIVAAGAVLGWFLVRRQALATVRSRADDEAIVEAARRERDELRR